MRWPPSKLCCRCSTPCSWPPAAPARPCRRPFPALSQAGRRRLDRRCQWFPFGTLPPFRRRPATPPPYAVSVPAAGDGSSIVTTLLVRLGSPSPPQSAPASLDAQRSGRQFALDSPGRSMYGFICSLPSQHRRHLAISQPACGSPPPASDSSRSAVW